MEFASWFFGFLYFHRKIIIGGVLLLGLGYWIYNSKDIIDRFYDPNDAANKSTVIEQPKDDTTSKSTGESTNQTASSNKNDSDSATEPVTTTDVTTDASENTIDGTPDPVEPPRKDMDAGDYVDAILEIGDTWRNEKGQAAASISLHEKLKLSEEMLSLQLSEAQRHFAKVTFMESVSVLDSVNVSGDIQDESIRPKLLATIKKYKDDPDDQVKSLAYLAEAVFPANDLLANPTDENLSAFTGNLESHIDKILLHPPNALVFGSALLRACKAADWKAEAVDPCRAALKKYENHSNPEVSSLYERLFYQLEFGKLELGTLEDRIARQDPSGDVDAQELLDTLARLPDSPLNYYNAANDVIREKIKLGQTEEAKRIIQFIESKILPAVTEKSKRQRVQDAINEFLPYL